MLRNLLRPDSGLMITMTQLTDTIFLSLFWILGCLPGLPAGGEAQLAAVLAGVPGQLESGSCSHRAVPDSSESAGQRAGTGMERSGVGTDQLDAVFRCRVSGGSGPGNPESAVSAAVPVGKHPGHAAEKHGSSGV